MKNHYFDSFDREYLAELIEAFPVDPPISLEEALNQIKDKGQQWSPFVFVDLLRNQDISLSLEELLPYLPRILHQQMFSNILSNAGCYRESLDALKGRVEFGFPTKKINDKAESSNSRFNAVSPNEIEKGVGNAIKKLAFDGSDPISNSAEFYQRFVRVHPFYDGNGRIGRYIVEAYLYHHGNYVRWEEMKKNNRWIRQMNYCHRKMTPLTINTSYPAATKWWIHHFRKFVLEVEIEPEE